MTAERDQQAERDHAEFAGWFEAQDYTTGAFESDSMAEAFTAGMQAARDLGDWFEVGDADAGTLPAAPRPAPERDKLRDALEDIARAAQGSIDASLPTDHDWFVSRAMEGLGWLPGGWPKAERPAPERADVLSKRFFHLASELENEAAANGCFCESKTLLDAATRIRRALDTDQP